VIPGETDAPGELPRVGTGAGVSQYLSNVYLVSWDVPDLPSTAARGARAFEGGLVRGISLGVGGVGGGMCFKPLDLSL